MYWPTPTKPGRGWPTPACATRDRPPGQPDPDFAADLQLARDVRESLRAMIANHTGGQPLTEAELRPLERSRAKPGPGWR